MNPAPRRRQTGEHGQMIVLFALILVALMAMAALVVDVGVLRRANQELWTATDAAALAGASQLPANGANASALAIQFAQTNYKGLATSSIGVSFRCLVGDRDNNGIPDAGDIPSVCNPGNNVAGLWVCSAGLCAAPCVPAEGDTCNTVVVASAVSVPFRFGGAVGVTSGSTQLVVSAACTGPCGAVPTVPLDLVLIVDRTGSMDATDLANAKDGARNVLLALNPDIQRVALGVLGPSNTGATCTGVNSPAKGIGASAAQYGSTYPGDLTKWIPVGLTGTGAPVNESYLDLAGTGLNTGSMIVKTIECLGTSSTGTNLSTPIAMARQYLAANGRAGVTKGILFETDGTPNFGAGNAADYTCLAANNEATTAKAAGIDLYTVGFGITGADLCPDTSGAWKGKSVTNVLASMAVSSIDNGCNAAENADGDHYYCQPKSSDLKSVFLSAVTALTGGTRLIQLPGT